MADIPANIKSPLVSGNVVFPTDLNKDKYISQQARIFKEKRYSWTIKKCNMCCR
jgi:hypothetical protein